MLSVIHQYNYFCRLERADMSMKTMFQEKPQNDAKHTLINQKDKL